MSLASERTSPSAQTFAKLMGEGPIALVALEAALGEIEVAAFIVSQTGTVLHTNARGARRLARSRDRMRVVLARAIQSRSDPDSAALVTPLRTATSGPIYFLVIFRPRTTVTDTVAYAASLWGLTARQREVLGLLVEGFANKTIAVKLRCAERTVETHLTAIFAKSGLDGRSALLAAFASGTP